MAEPGHRYAAPGMTRKLIQKHLLYGTQELELLDDTIRIKITSPFKETKELEVVLAMLNPVPEVGSLWPAPSWALA